jgi:U6 snRNA phosphodiesterase
MSEHEMLTSLLEEVQKVFGSSIQLNSFLTSDLGAPLPLHVSLSRPIVLNTLEKDDFLEKITKAITSSGISQYVFTANAPSIATDNFSP